MGHSVSLTRTKGFVRIEYEKILFFVPESMASFFGVTPQYFLVMVP